MFIFISEIVGGVVVVGLLFRMNLSKLLELLLFGLFDGLLVLVGSLWEVI